jgi:ferredoxin
MRIDQEKCTRCGACLAYCPVGAIRNLEKNGEWISEIVQEECVECGVCFRSEICLSNALVKPELNWPRSIRAIFSDPLSTHAATGVRGRGTNEVKTNDVTGRYRSGEAGVLIEMGRPGIGTSFKDLETITMAMTELGVHFEPENPVTSLIVDKKSGKINPKILREKVLSAIIEFKVDIGRLAIVLQKIREISGSIKTVFSLSLIGTVEKNASLPVFTIAMESGFRPYPNAKVNLGFGRPLSREI